MSGFLKIAGDLSRWNIYRKAACVSDVTEMFIRRPFHYNTRTIDQMRKLDSGVAGIRIFS